MGRPEALEAETGKTIGEKNKGKEWNERERGKGRTVINTKMKVGVKIVINHLQLPRGWSPPGARWNYK